MFFKIVTSCHTGSVRNSRNLSRSATATTTATAAAAAVTTAAAASKSTVNAIKRGRGRGHGHNARSFHMNTIINNTHRSCCSFALRSFLVGDHQEHQYQYRYQYHQYYHHHRRLSSSSLSSLSSPKFNPKFISKPKFLSTRSAAKNTSSYNNNTTNTNTKTKTKIQPFLLTDIGEGITEVELLRWYVNTNEHISQFDKVCEVQSDKATVDITSRYDGIVHSLNDHNEGDMVQVGQPLMYISVVEEESDDDDNGDDNGDEIGDNHSMDMDMNMDTEMEQQQNNNLATPTSTSTNTTNSSYSTNIKNNNNNNSNNNNKVLATPAVRKLGKQYNLNLASIRGSGSNGRVMKEDVLKVLGLINGGNVNSNVNGISESVGVGIGVGVNGNTNVNSDINNIHDINGVSVNIPLSNANTNASSNTNTSFKTSQDNDNNNNNNNDHDEGTIIPIRGYHRLMVTSMTTTLQVPHMTYSDEVEMTSLIQCRNDLNQMIQKNNKHNSTTNNNNKNNDNTNNNTTKLSFLPFMIKACSLSMKEYPILNSSIDVSAMNITLHSRHDIGIAMDSDRGLVVPVIRNCEALSIMDIALELNRLRELAENGSLSEKDLVHPTFTISNIGSIGGTIMSPVILPPQVAIGAMGKIQRVPRFVSEDSMDVRESHVMNISWGGDHRVIDGATLGRFSNLWKAYIESPMMMAFAMK